MSVGPASLPSCPHRRVPRPPRSPTAAPSAVGPAPSGWASAGSAASGEPWRRLRSPTPRVGAPAGPWALPGLCDRPWPPAPSGRSAPRRPGPVPPGWVNWTGSWAAGSCRVPLCCWPVSPASASPRCCSTSPRRQPLWLASGGTGRSSTSPVRSRPRRYGCGPSASTPWIRGCSWPRRPSWGPCWGTWRRPIPPCWWWTRFRPSPRRRSRAVPGASPRCGPWPVHSSRWLRSAISRCCSWVM